MRFNEQKISTGTGFICKASSGYVLITNRHNVTGSDQNKGMLLSKTGAIPNEIVIHHNLSAGLGSWGEYVEPILNENGEPLWKEHPTLGAKADFIALKLRNIEGAKLYPYTFDDEAEIEITPADVVSVVGFPFGLSSTGRFAIWATGFVASELDLDYKDLPIFLIDCRSRKGQSGSAVIAFRNGGAHLMKDGGTGFFELPLMRFLGIYSGRINDESDIGIVWKVSAIRELLENL